MPSSSSSSSIPRASTFTHGVQTTTPARATVVSRQSACPAADVDSLLGLPIVNSLPLTTQSIPLHVPLQAALSFLFPLLCFAYVSYFLASSSNTQRGIVCFCFLGSSCSCCSLCVSLLVRICAYACRVTFSENVSEWASVCLSVCVCVCLCATLTLFVRFVPARNFIHKTCVAFACFCLLYFFCLLFVLVVVALLCVQKEQKSLSASPLASKTAQNPCRFLSLPSFVTTTTAAATAAATRPCNG